MKKYFAFLFAVLLPFFGKSQEIVSGGGDEHSNAQGSISWTLGEPVSGLLGGSNALTQGFQQPGLPDLLPIELFSFEVEVIQDNLVALRWETVTEINNDFFTIERSPDNLHYTSIGTVEGKGNSLIRQSYSFEDRQPLEGVSYYRLKQTDTNGAFSYSDVRTVLIVPESSVQIYPNPFQDQLFVSGQFEGTVEIFDLSGKRVFQLTSYSSPSSLLKLELADFPQGMYMLKLSNERGFQSSYRIIKTD